MTKDKLIIAITGVDPDAARDHVPARLILSYGPGQSAWQYSQLLAMSESELLDIKSLLLDADLPQTKHCRRVIPTINPAPE